MDSTHIKANANKYKFNKEMTYTEARAYQDELENEINEQRIKEGENPFTWGTESELKERKISKSDPESGYHVKGEREKNLLSPHIQLVMIIDFSPVQLSHQRMFMIAKLLFN